VHPAHNAQTKRLRHLNFFQHECYLEVRTPRLKLPDGRIEPDWFGMLSGFTLLFGALVLTMAQQMTFAAVARLVNESWHRVHAICSRYVDLAVAQADLSRVIAVAIDETSCRRGHDYLTITADAEERKHHRPLCRTPGHAQSAARADRRGEHRHVAGLMRGVANQLPKARITFDKFYVVAHASAALDQTRRLEQRVDPSLKGLRWTLLKDRHRLSAEGRADLDALISQAATKRTARAWLYREQLRAILDRKQINVVSAMLKQ
jgi:transposase